MPKSLHGLLATGVILTLLVSVVSNPAFARKKKPSSIAAAIPQMNPDEKVLHTLNRLAFGPNPGDERRLRAIGLQKWIDEQLHPESIPENTVLEAKLQPLSTLNMSPIEMATKYPPNFLVKQMVDGKVPWPTDPETRLTVQRLAEKYRDKLGLPPDPQNPPLTYDQVLSQFPADQQQVLQNGKPEEKGALLQTLSLQQQFDFLTLMPNGQRAKIYEAAPDPLRRRMRLFGGTQQLVNQDLFDAKIFRAVYSNRQLGEVLTDFWYNHFNVYLDKGGDRYLVTSYERDAIRPLVLGKFKDLLLATAQSPAMLYYLDNFESVGPDANPHPNPLNKGRKRGLNENYGRELMELHTLGVDGGYTQQDVTEVARCFTGWTIREPRKGAGFEFNMKQHDKGEKHVLGVKIKAGGGIEDGLQVIDILAHHPSTAHFISRSLAIRFVSDNPPPAMVDRMAATFVKSDGDLREVMRVMLTSPEFWAQTTYRAKIKSPFEMVVSALRATNAQVDFTNAIVGQLNNLGEPLYRKQEPTGYSNKGADWMNSAALLGRMNFALNLSANKIAGVKVSIPVTTDPDAMAQDFIGTNLTADSREVVEKGLQAQLTASQTSSDMPPVEQPVAAKPPQSKAPTPALVAGLTLGSPDFQRR